MDAQREQWTSRRAFLLAAIGGAVGMGNIWRFSYVAGENGGGAFLFIYAFCVLLIGVPLVIAELAIGRQGQGDAVAAFRHGGAGRGPWMLIGWLGVIAAVLLLSYYAVIAGWAMKYLFGAVTNSLWRAASTDYGGYFNRFIADRGQPVAWQAATLGIAMLVVTGGVRRGIERVNRVLMPLLAAILIMLAGYSLSLPGSSAGLAFLFQPDWSAFLVPDVYAAALGQAFFTLGVGMAFFVTYGGYMPRTFPAPVSAGVIAAGDTLFAVVAGLAIFPAVFALGGDPAAGPELVFITLPQIFLEMPAGGLIGATFFFLLAAAAVTSMIALLEIPVSVLTYRRRMRRGAATAMLGGAVFLLGVPSALSYGVLAEVRIGSLGVLEFIDHAVSNYLLPAVGIGTALFVGWRLERATALEGADLLGTRLGPLWRWLVRFLAPISILAILLQSTGAI